MPVTMMFTIFTDVMPCSLVANHSSRAWRQNSRFLHNNGY